MKVNAIKAENHRIELLRGLLALGVLIGHLRALWFVDYSSLNDPIWIPFYLVTGLGHQCVMVFFILSGYLVGGGVIQKIFVKKDWCWTQYLIRRLARLWIVLIPALMMGYAIEKVGTRVFSEHPRYREFPLTFSKEESKRFGYVQEQSVVSGSSASTYLGNVFFLQRILVPTAGGNGPLWSLANEFWYYLIFPLLLIGFARLHTPWIRVFSFGLGILILVWLPSFISILFSSWVLGALLAFLEARFGERIALSRMKRVAAVMMGGILVLLASRFSGSDFQSESIAVIGGILLCLSCLGKTGNEGSPKRGGLSTIGRICYSLYLVHMPIVSILSAFLFPNGRVLPTLLLLAGWSGVVTAVVGFAVLFYSQTEAHTDRIRSYFEQKLLA